MMTCDDAMRCDVKRCRRAKYLVMLLLPFLMCVLCTFDFSWLHVTSSVGDRVGHVGWVMEGEGEECLAREVCPSVDSIF